MNAALTTAEFASETAGVEKHQAAVLMINGSYDTLKHNPDREYGTMDWAGILALVNKPTAFEKKLAPAIIPSTYTAFDGRVHDVQRERGNFVMLAADIDKGNPSLEQVIEATQGIAGYDAEFLVYSTGSSTESLKKWRVLIPLGVGLPGEEFTGIQNALFSLYRDRGIQCDDSLNRTAQPVYLPNVPKESRSPDGAPLFYANFHHKGGLLDLSARCAIVVRCSELYRHDRQAQELALADARRRRDAKKAENASEGLNPTQWFNENHSIEALLLEYGYKRNKKGHWRSPQQKSGTFATMISDDGEAFVSLSGSDRDAGLGAISKKSNAVFGDAFDLYCFYQHGNDHAKAWAAIRRMMPRDPFSDTKRLEETLRQFAVQGETFDNWGAEGENFAECIERHDNAAGTKPGPTALVPFSKFVASLQPPDYLIDNILQRGWLYSLTAKTGSGKTAVALDLAVRVAEGKPLGALETSKGQVVYLSGENPEDVKARCLMLAKHHGVTDPAIFFLEGANDLEKNIDWLIRQIEAVGGASLVIVDTSAAYFGGDDDNSNVELGAYARLFRRFCKMDCRPSVVVLAHPTKNPSKENLVPRGGGAFLNEVDGNLTLWTEDKEITSLHWQGKFRGPDFEPIQFRLRIIKDEQYLDSKGRLLPSVIALPIDAVQAERIEEETHKQEDRVLLSFDDNPDLSIRERARLLGFVAENGQPLKGRVERILAQLVEGKLLTRNRQKQYRLTDVGQKEVAALRGYRKGKKDTKNAGQ